jgi:hypothetical protein
LFYTQSILSLNAKAIARFEGLAIAFSSKIPKGGKLMITYILNVAGKNCTLIFTNSSSLVGGAA